MFIDRLIEKIIEKKNPTLVGLDPQEYLIPKCIYEPYIDHEEGMGEVLWQFNKLVIDALSPIIPAIKPQIAFYEQWGVMGLKAYEKTIAYAKEKDLIVLGDIKRGDVASTAKAYAKAHLTGDFACDAVTINPYLGRDSVEPFLELCKSHSKGIFVLVKTSNPSSGEIQNLISSNKTIYMHIADTVKSWGQDFIGGYGYSAIGAVVGATYPKESQELRREMPSTFFLVPGYGAQGGKAEDILHSFDNKGLGAIVNSSRGILGAYREEGENPSLEAFQSSLIKAAEKMKKELMDVLIRAGKDEIYRKRG